MLSLNSDPKVLEHVSHIQSVLSGLKPQDALEASSSSSPKPLPLSTIHLPVDIDTNDRSLGKKIAEARRKKYNHIIVVGGREVDSNSLNLQLVNQPQEDVTFEVLEKKLERQLTDQERSKGVNVPLDVARKYFEQLANSFL